jgi:hypothetical protein
MLEFDDHGHECEVQRDWNDCMEREIFWKENLMNIWIFLEEGGVLKVWQLEVAKHAKEFDMGECLLPWDFSL